MHPIHVVQNVEQGGAKHIVESGVVIISWLAGNGWESCCHGGSIMLKLMQEGGYILVTKMQGAMSQSQWI